MDAALAVRRVDVVPHAPGGQGCVLQVDGAVLLATLVLRLDGDRAVLQPNVDTREGADLRVHCGHNELVAARTLERALEVEADRVAIKRIVAVVHLGARLDNKRGSKAAHCQRVLASGELGAARERDAVLAGSTRDRRVRRDLERHAGGDGDRIPAAEGSLEVDDGNRGVRRLHLKGLLHGGERLIGRRAVVVVVTLRADPDLSQRGGIGSIGLRLVALRIRGGAEGGSLIVRGLIRLLLSRALSGCGLVAGSRLLRSGVIRSVRRGLRRCDGRLPLCLILRERGDRCQGKRHRGHRDREEQRDTALHKCPWRRGGVFPVVHLRSYRVDTATSYSLLHYIIQHGD